MRIAPVFPWSAAACLMAAAACGMVLAAAIVGHRLGEAQGLAALRSDIDHRLDLFAATAQGRIDRLAHVPATLQLQPEVLDLFQDRGEAPQQAAQQLLRSLNTLQGSTAVFVVDERGIVIATSHAGGADDSRLGEDLSYRPYYLEALSGRAGRHFAVGGALPGYFFSHPIRDGGRVVGVAVVKVSLSPIDQAFPLLGTPACIIDRNEVVVLSSRPGWLYSAMKPLTEEARIDLELTGMYGDRGLGAFSLRAADASLPAVPPPPLTLAWAPDAPRLALQVPADAAGSHEGLLVQGRRLEGLDWRLLAFSDLAPVHARAQGMAVLAALAAALAIVTVLYLLQRRQAAAQQASARRHLQRLNAELEDTVARRTRALTDANEGLRREMVVRVQAEATLRAAQDELVQAAKLAVMGQLSTGITHELAQPLGAIRTLAGNAREFIRRGDLEGAHGNLAIVDTLVERMGGIIHPFKAFARKSPVEPEAVPVAAALKSALFLLDQRLRAESVAVHCQPAVDGEPPAEPRAWCNRNRLEQVLINLIGNAVDAMRGAPRRELHIEARQHDGRIVVTLADSGPGLSPDVLAGLFTPFFTTKPPGSGLGLGLVISRGIAQDYGGDLAAAPRPEGGAVFTLTLPAAPPACAP